MQLIRFVYFKRLIFFNESLVLCCNAKMNPGQKATNKQIFVKCEEDVKIF